MNAYKLLTPGPLTTTETVKEAMLTDHCTWDNDYKMITQNIRKRLIRLANATEENYTAVLLQGSGTYGVESVLTSSVGDGVVLLVTNGAYGKRMVQICSYAGIRYMEYNVGFAELPDADHVEKLLLSNEEITHIAMVHCETTSGILNDIESIARVAKAYNKTFIVDAMSSFGGIEILVETLGIDFIISSANKCIQGVPGFIFIIAKRDALAKTKGNCRSLSLDLYAQFEEMEKDGKWRFTSPTHTVLAFSKALDELEAEGGVKARQKRYTENNRTLIANMRALGFKTYVAEENQSPIITSFLYPENKNFHFGEMYEYIKDRGYAIYPGKVTDIDTFRIGNIGEIYAEDIERITEIFKSLLEAKNIRGDEK